MRSQGQVRFIKVGPRIQMLAVVLALVLLVGWAVALAVMSLSHYRAGSDRAALLDREAQVATAENRVQAYRGALAARTADLEERQEFLEAMLSMLPEDILTEEEIAESGQTEDELISVIGSSIPEAAALGQVEARQLAFAERLTRYADRRAASAEEAIRTLGLDPRLVLASAERAMGGPLEVLASDADGSLDPRFERMALSLGRMNALERGLDGIPQVMPADIRNISSGFGYRSDPFTGRAAMHSGLDFRGPQGAPIHAAADGRVSFVGTKSGYGKVVEISHGNGMMTRYAHMSRHNARVGQEVAAGDLIGAIGSTGRSTGPHLHFEVRINNRPVNPRPFLDTAAHVVKEARAEFALGGDAPHAHGAD